MKKLFTSKDAEQMAALHRFLTQQGIPVTVSERGEQLELWVTQTSYQALAKQQVDAFKADPTIANVSSSSVNTATNTPLWQTLYRHGGPITWLLAVLIVVVFIALQTPVSDDVLQHLLISHSFTRLATDEPWRFITPMLLHFSAVHFVFNAFWWVYLGGRIERAYPWWWLPLLVIITSVIANIAQFYSTGPMFGGMSGVVYGLFGFSALLSFKQPSHPLYLPPALIGFMLVWLLLGYTGVLWVNVANEAHLAGLLSGLAIGVIAKRYQQRTSDRRI